MKHSLAIFGALLVLLVVFVYVAGQEVRDFDRSPRELTVSYLDVGQGDATLIESPQGTQVLIDGGRDASVLRELPKSMGYLDRTIDMIVATHPDSDHIAGLIDVLNRYDVKSIVMTTNENDTPVSRAFQKAVRDEGAQVIMAKRGQVFDLGVGAMGSTTLTVLFPDRDVTNLESNMSSIIMKLTYGTTDFMFTGDSPSAIEDYLVDLDGTSLQSEVLKVGHHGSRTSTDSLFLEMVRPKYGVISAGKNNDYGHPHKEVLERLKVFNVVAENTADVGTIRFVSDGSVLTQE